MANKPATAAKTTADTPTSAMDYAEHERTYKGFMELTKWSVIAIAVLLIVLYFVVKP